MGSFFTLMITVIMGLGLIGCGGSPTVALSGKYDCSDGSCGNVRLLVNGTKASVLKSPYAQIQSFLVEVSGPGIDGSLSGEFPGDAEEGVIEGVPAGEDRLVSVSAINVDDDTIRAGETGGVSVQGGATSDVEIDLEAVPIFVNLGNDSIVENTRLVFRVFSESSGPLLITNSADTATTTLVDAATSAPEIYLDLSTGLGSLAPALIDPGAYTFKVSDPSTERFSEVDLRLLDGSKRKAAPLFSSSGVGLNSSNPIRRFGQAFSDIIPWILNMVD